MLKQLATHTVRVIVMVTVMLLMQFSYLSVVLGAEAKTVVGTDPAKSECQISGKVVDCGQNRVLITPCELFQRAALYNKGIDYKGPGGEDLRDYVCTEFLDPLPATGLANVGNKAICLQVDTKKDVSKSLRTNAMTMSIDYISTVAGSTNKYCHGIAQKSGGNYDALLVVVVIFFNWAIPILVSLGVMAVAYIGIKIMFSSGGSEEGMKKAIEEFKSVLYGLILLFSIKLFLLTINSIFFTT